MNFLMLRSNNQTAVQEQQSVKESQVEVNYVSKSANTLEGLIAEDSSPERAPSETRNPENYAYEGESGSITSSSEESNSQVNIHLDVTEDDGLIIIPYKEIPDNWMEAPDILSFRPLDRRFVFPGEQIRILSCLSACKQDTEIITPFKVAAVMNKNGIAKGNKKHNGNTERQENLSSQNGETDSPKDVPTGESLLRMEDHKRQTEQLLRRFKTSHFFARIAESDEPLWTKRSTPDTFSNGTLDFSETEKTMKRKKNINAAIDRGTFDASRAGGVARDAGKCCSLPNGDIVVLLHVNIGVDFVKDPVLEILQFEKYQERNFTQENQIQNQDPSGDLLKWLLPLENSIPPPSRPLSPPTVSSSSSIRTTSTKPALSGSSTSQLFSFNNFRSYSMSSLPPNSTPPPSAVVNAKPSFEPEDWNQFSFRKFVGNGKIGEEGLMSFRGVPLEPERFSVRCGLEGIFTPGRRWRRKIEIIQPVEIQSYSVDCNTDDLLCVHVKNVSPAHAPDIVVFIDAITIVFEEASTDGPPSPLPIACIEAGDEYSLPNLTLRRGEEHSFILKPATSLLKSPKGQNDRNFKQSRIAASNWHNSSITEGDSSGSPANHYAILVSCRCNYTESKLFFKQPTSWRPRISRDLMISVTSEMSTQTLGSNGTQLPVQVLTLQASNMTPADLTLTVLAPASFTAPPSVLSLTNSPSSPLSPFAAFADVPKVEDGLQSVSFNERPVLSNDLGCTHLWLQSRVPLGCVPSQSMATIKLEVLPLTDGIITLDSLQIDVKEKGLTYIPEHSLKINATSSISTGMI